MTYYLISRKRACSSKQGPRGVKHFSIKALIPETNSYWALEERPLASFFESCLAVYQQNQGHICISTAKIEQKTSLLATRLFSYYYYYYYHYDASKKFFSVIVAMYWSLNAHSLSVNLCVITFIKILQYDKLQYQYQHSIF